MMRAELVILALVASLAGCQRDVKADAPEQAERTADAIAARDLAVRTDFSQPMMARGNEPFWAVRMDGTKLTLSRPGQPDVAFDAPGGVIKPGQGAWTATSADGRAMTLKLYVSECSDGMSDMRYPMSAEVMLGAETLRGCAAKVSEMPRERPGG